MRDGPPKTEQGFTLMELLIVIVVMAVISGIAVFALSGTTASALVAACKADASTVEAAADAYHSQVGQWPAGPGDLAASGYLRSTPSSSHYSISVGSKGEINVTVNPTDPANRLTGDFDANRSG